MGIGVIAEGGLETDGTEQTLVEFIELGKMEGYVNLSNLAFGDTVVLRQYQKILGEFIQYVEESYSNAQTSPAIYITPKSGKDGIKITIQQTAGVLRTFTYCFFKEIIDDPWLMELPGSYPMGTAGKIIGDMETDLALVRQIEEGRWKIVNNQMYFYGADNITVVAVFDLLDANGMPTMQNVFERRRV